jgi:hypothetical protein
MGARITVVMPSSPVEPFQRDSPAPLMASHRPFGVAAVAVLFLLLGLAEVSLGVYYLAAYSSSLVVSIGVLEFGNGLLRLIASPSILKGRE